VLVVGDPAFDPADFPRLPRLPGAVTEAQRIGAVLGPQAQLLLGERATAAAVAAAVRGRRILHFAGHTAGPSEADRPGSLILAPATGHDGLVGPDEWRDLGLGGLDLIVLSACGSADRHWGSWFLGEGVGGVITPLWEVDDDQAAIAVAFYRALGAGDPPARALRSAQLASLAAPLRHWAGLQYHQNPAAAGGSG
jgi:CHAT domain-containing protein